MSLLLVKPQPLIDSDRRIIVLWSPKSACTTAYVWFSGLCGFLEDVRNFDPWPHNHRTKVFLKSARFRKSAAADSSRFHVVKIIRDPYSRAVSIFRHAVRNRFADADAAAAGLNFEAGVSFRDFLGVVRALDMETANVHYRPQWHPFERERKPDTVINISNSDLLRELNALERRVGWPVTDFASMAWLHELETARRVQKLSTDKRRFFAEPVARCPRAKETPFPDDAAFLTPQAKRLIERIYHIDFEAYRDHL